MTYVSNRKTFLHKIRDLILRKAIVNKEKVKILYEIPNGDTTDRIIYPMYLITYLSSEYIFGYCELRLDYRIFKIDRIKSMRVQSTYFSTERLPFNCYECGLPGILIVDDGKETIKTLGKSYSFKNYQDRYHKYSGSDLQVS